MLTEAAALSSRRLLAVAPCQGRDRDEQHLTGGKQHLHSHDEMSTLKGLRRVLQLLKQGLIDKKGILLSGRYEHAAALL